MKCLIAGVCALALPVPALSFTTSLAVSHIVVSSRGTPAPSAAVGAAAGIPAATHVCTRFADHGLCQSRRNIHEPASLHMTSQAVNFPGSLGTSLPRDTTPLPTTPTSSPTPVTPAFDRTNLGLHVNIGSKVINLYGLLFAGEAWLTALVMFPLCFLAGVVSPIFDWRRMRPPTMVALLWGRLSMLVMGVRPTVEGLDLLPPKDEAVVFVANHGSYLDIPVTNFLPRLCKYLMKAELLWLPIVGWKAVLARDIFVHRQTSATFRKLLKSTTRSLQAGNSIMTFPEGTRSRDGRLGEFKRGPFTMAQRAGVRVVPVTITGVASAMPPFAMAPLRKPRNVRLRIHPAIDTKGRSVRDVMADARRAVSDGLEAWQRPPDLASPASPPASDA